MEDDGAPEGEALLVLGAGPAQVGLLRAAQERGLHVIAVDRDPRAPGFRYADRRAILSSEDEPAVERLARSAHVAGIVAPGTDWPVGVAARIADHLRLPHPLSPASAALAVSKLRQRERFDERGVPQPAWRALTREDPLDRLPTRAVVKAPDRQGQRGLSLVTRPEDLAPAVARAFEASRAGVALVEELVEGPEVTVNAFSVGGRFIPLTVTDRVTAEPPAFGVALAHVWPSERADERAVETAERAAEALGIEHGPTYTQLRLGPNGPQVIELAARLGGGHDAELCHAALGVELNGLAIAAALGEPLEPPRPEPQVGGACTRFLVPPEGRLTTTQGVEAARAVEGVVDLHVYRSPGHEFGPFRTGSDRAGAVIAVGASREEALARARRVTDLIRFVVTDAEVA
ncbi:MAG TPA: ATP-grasp domain-containing protein [Gaiellaceae bacterium]|nr:ATP-grasp domain-containing protein [Gaiellaceae bacterium]